MGNDESCCVEIDKNKGQIESKINSLKYSSIIHNADNIHSQSNFRDTKKVFSNQSIEPEGNIVKAQSSVLIHSTRINNKKESKTLKQDEIMNILEINRQTLRSNIKIIRRYIGSAKICFPVKANAYGHGIEQIVQITHDLVDFFAVANSLEAFRVRAIAKNPVLVFGVIYYEYIDRMIAENIRVSIQDFQHIERLEQIARQCNKKIYAHINVNTGMNRMGVCFDDACRTIKKAYDSDWLVLEGVYSHLACADNKDHPTNQKQKNKFSQIVQYTKKLSKSIICHLSNSYGFLGDKEICYDMIRPGIVIYGFLPQFSLDNAVKQIKPIARLLSKVVKIITLQEGEGVGYSMIYKGFQGEKLAVIPIGYGDGFPRQLGNRGFVNINNVIYPMAGRMSMDGLTVSLGKNDNDVKVGDTVELISDIPLNQNSAFSIAKITNTIEYDIMSTLNDRVIRKLISQNTSHLMFQKRSKESFNHNYLSQASFSSHQQKFYRQNLQNPQKGLLINSNELNQETVKYLRASKASQEQQYLDNHYRSDIDQHQVKGVSELSTKKQNTSIQKTKGNIQKQLTIEYLPIVRKVIERQKPFETQLERIPKEKIKTIRINEGKDIYKGQINYYQKPHGYGVLAKENGNILIGKFDNGSINGLAYYIFNNGSYYDGYMVNNKANDDKGQFHTKNMSYIGGFKDNLFHGQGKEISDHYYFQGFYQNHLKKSGTLMWRNSSISNHTHNSFVYPQNEAQIPKVRMFQSPSHYDFIYEGSFDQNQQFTGKGKLKDSNGEYNGQFLEGKKHGQGTYFFENNLKYVGEYKNNQKQGWGKLYNCDNTMAYEGFWKDNLPNGKGYSYGMYNTPVELQFVQGISTLLAPQSK